MTERIEWIEPEEATRERREKARQSNSRLNRTILRSSLIIGVPAELSVLCVAPESALVVGLSILYLPFIVALASLSQERSQKRQTSERKCVLDAGDAHRWEHLRSFEISDHQTLPGIRTLKIRASAQSARAQCCFREGQLDEAELRAFIEARIAEQRTRRLMRRVKM